MKKLLFILLLSSFNLQGSAQSADCQLKPPRLTIHFGAGNISDLNTTALSNYARVTNSCPTDGHYTYTSATSDCFSGDWFTLTEDHTPGDAAGNMLLVNASHSSGTFFTTTINGLKSNTTYEYALWMMNVCRLSEKCPFPLLPDIIFRLQTPSGKVVAQFRTGELARYKTPQWKRYKALFTTPPSTTSLILTMSDSAPGGCGNDFALDDITFRECVKQPPAVTAKPKAAVTAKKEPVPTKKVNTVPEKKQPQVSAIKKQKIDTSILQAPVLKQRAPVFPAPPPILTNRTNALVKQIETEAGEIRLDLYDNGEIDGDTISIYHNNTLVVAHAKLSQKPITLRIAVDAAQPHHEFVMVAENLGSIPPNTSLMIVTTRSNRYQVFISSTEQKNAKVVFDLKD